MAFPAQTFSDCCVLSWTLQRICNLSVDSTWLLRVLLATEEFYKLYVVASYRSDEGLDDEKMKNDVDEKNLKLDLNSKLVKNFATNYADRRM